MEPGESIITLKGRKMCSRNVAWAYFVIYVISKLQLN